MTERASPRRISAGALGGLALTGLALFLLYGGSYVAARGSGRLELVRGYYLSQATTAGEFDLTVEAELRWDRSTSLPVGVLVGAFRPLGWLEQRLTADDEEALRELLLKRLEREPGDAQPVASEAGAGGGG